MDAHDSCGGSRRMKSLAQLCKPRQSVFDHNRRDIVLDLTDLAEGRIDPGELLEGRLLELRGRKQAQLALKQ